MELLMDFKVRLKSSLFYTGFIPFFPALLFKRNKDDIIVNEYSNALAVSFIQTTTFLVGLIIWIFGFYAVAQYHPSSLETLRFGNIFILGYLVLFVWVFGISIWLVYFIRSIFQLKITIPLITKISKNKTVLTLSYFFNLFCMILFCVIVFWTIRSNKLAQNIQKPAKVYMLYDDMGFVPHCIFPLGFYQIQRAAIEKWGSGCVSIEPITNESLREAIKNATMIFLSVHGDLSSGEFAGMFHFANQTRDKFYGYGPDQIKEMGAGENLKFIYLAHCNGGILEDEWSQAFKPAKTKSFDRISLYPEHIYWLWFKLPRILRHDI
jgi:hypothetical protein